jgi:hypothetical protein
VKEGALSGDPDDPRGLRVDDENGREICASLATSSAEPFELRCLRFGGRYAARAELFGRRGMRGFGVAYGVDEARAEGHLRRTVAIFFNFEDAALDRIRAELPLIWRD